MAWCKPKTLFLCACLLIGWLTLSVRKAEALSISISPISFGGIVLTGANQVIAGSTTDWQVDALDESGGWNVTVTSTDFVNGDGKTIPVSNFEIRLQNEQINVLSGDALGPVSAQTVFASLSEIPLKIVSTESGTGNGVYTLLPDFQLTVPAQSYAGTYSATVTVQVNVGP